MEATTTLEPVLSTSLSEQLVYNAKPSEVHKLMALVAIDHNLKLSIQRDYEQCLAQLINRVKNN